MSNKTICYLDMDGVLADFESHVHLTTGFSIYGFRNKELNFVEQQIQQTVFSYVDYSPTFWKTMPRMIHSEKLVDFCKSRFDEVKILSSFKPPKEKPDRFISVRKDKIDWILKTFPNKFGIEDIIITKEPKHLHIQPNKINYLIDDSVQEIRSWKEQGGQGILYTGYQNIVKLFNMEIGRCR